MTGILSFLKRLLRSPHGSLGLFGVSFLLLIAIFGPSIAPQDPEAFNYGTRFAGPSADHWLGTDWYGRDLFSRVLAGAQSTVFLAIIATLIGTGAGTLIGVVSGYVGGRSDEIIMRVIDALMAIPGLLFALMIIAVLGSSSWNAVLAIGIAAAPGMARIARSVTLQVRSTDYVAAAQSRGEGAIWIVLAEILPNVIAPVIVEATIRVAFAIMTLATLSFLGLGAQPPSPEWGLMIADARDHLFRSPWPVIVPAVPSHWLLFLSIF